MPGSKKIELSFETLSLRKELSKFLDQEILDPILKRRIKIGAYKFGVYAFYDYDSEPIYVGQTREKIGGRIGRHLTNQRTDAVAMSVLDPFEVYEIEVWPIPEFEGRSTSDKKAREHLDSLEYQIYHKCIAESKFAAVLNEKEPRKTELQIEIPKSYREKVVSEEVMKIRNHPDIRIARRAATISKLAQVISERSVNSGLRKTLLIQAKRLQWLAENRLKDI